MKKRPHIILFNPDQMRSDALHHLGNPAAITPNLDAFAANDAVSFSNAFCQNPVCTPSRCSFLTGLYPHVHGQRTMTHMLHQDQSSILQEMKSAGYHVWMTDRNDFLPAQVEGIFDQHATETYSPVRARPNKPVLSNPRGTPDSASYYSHYHGELQTDSTGINYSRDDDSVDAAIDLIRNRPDDQPLFLFLALFYPHPPYEVEEPYFSAIDRSKLLPRIQHPDNWDLLPGMLKGLHDRIHMKNWTEEQWDELRSCYLGMCMKIDHQFGKLCETLKSEGIYDDCVIFFFSDHGDFCGDYDLVEKSQNVLTENLMKVPFLVKPPKDCEIDPGISDSLVELIDFYATAMDFAGISPDHTHFGRSLKPVLADRNARHRDAVFAEGGRLQDEQHCTEKNDSGELNPKNPYYPRLTLQTESGTKHTKATMLRSECYKLVKRLDETDEFYDLENDPGQLHNLIYKPELQSLIVDYKLRMLNWYQRTCDVVPFKPDDRFTKASVLARFVNSNPELYEKAKHMMENGLSPQNVLIQLAR